jgi:hypothetical protein
VNVPLFRLRALRWTLQAEISSSTISLSFFKFRALLTLPLHVRLLQEPLFPAPAPLQARRGSRPTFRLTQDFPLRWHGVSSGSGRTQRGNPPVMTAGWALWARFLWTFLGLGGLVQAAVGCGDIQHNLVAGV